MSYIEYTAKNSGYYRVFVDGIKVSQHLQEREAAESAGKQKRVSPDKAVYYDHEYHVEVSLLPGKEPPKPPVEPDPDPEEPTEPDDPIIPDPPPVDPLPTDSTILPITLPNGELWNGLTNPPPTTFRTDHPRMLVTSETLPALREKLEHPLYTRDVAAVKASTNGTDRALCYLIWGDEAKGQSAISNLLAWTHKPWHSMEAAAMQVQGVLMYDWLYNLMTPEQRLEAMDVIRPNVRQGGPLRYYHSDHLTDHTYGYFLMALAFDDEWSAQYRQSLLDPEFDRFKIYRGLLDILTQSSLQNGGGWHAGNHAAPLGGYEGGYAINSIYVMRAWETCTGQSLFDKTTYFDRKPMDFLASRISIQNTAGANTAMRTAAEFYTGVNTGDSAALSKWITNKIGVIDGNPTRVPRMLFGDRRIEAKSPDELQLPTWGYLDGNNCVYVHSDWDLDSSFKCLFFARAWDRGRYEQFSSSLAIHKGNKAIIPLNTDWKAIGMDGYTGLRVYEAGKHHKQKLAYGTKDGHFPEDIINPNKPQFRPETLTSLTEENGVVTATCRFNHLLPVVSPPEICQRTVTIDPQSETVQVHDYVVGLGDNECLITFGLNKPPVITGNVAENDDVRITVLTEFAEFWWDDKELETDSRGSRMIKGVLKIAPAVAGNVVNSMILLEVK